MRKKFFYVIPLFFIISCVVEKQTFIVSYRFENSSGSEIILVFSEETNNEITNEIDLAQGETSRFFRTEISDENIISNSNSDLPESAFFSNISRVIFDNERELEISRILMGDENFFSPPVERNIFRQGNYDDLGNRNFQFVFTQEDYNNATPCDGPCE